MADILFDDCFYTRALSHGIVKTSRPKMFFRDLNIDGAKQVVMHGKDAGDFAYIKDGKIFFNSTGLEVNMNTSSEIDYDDEDVVEFSIYKSPYNAAGRVSMRNSSGDFRLVFINWHKDISTINTFNNAMRVVADVVLVNNHQYAISSDKKYIALGEIIKAESDNNGAGSNSKQKAVLDLYPAFAGYAYSSADPSDFGAIYSHEDKLLVSADEMSANNNDGDPVSVVTIITGYVLLSNNKLFLYGELVAEDVDSLNIGGDAYTRENTHLTNEAVNPANLEPSRFDDVGPGDEADYCNYLKEKYSDRATFKCGTSEHTYARGNLSWDETLVPMKIGTSLFYVDLDGDTFSLSGQSYTFVKDIKDVTKRKVLNSSCIKNFSSSLCVETAITMKFPEDGNLDSDDDYRNDIRGSIPLFGK